MNGRAATAALLVAVALFAGCKREQRDTPPPPAAALTDTIRLSELQPGQPPAPHTTTPVKTKSPYEERAYDVSQGQRLYRAYNCNGCHANGGGGMGPPLMDDTWIYGSDPANIVATILEGRPNGMPSFSGKIPDQQAWQLAAYVRSMSGQLRKDVAPGRADHMSAKNPESSTQPLAPKQGGTAPPSATGTQP